MGPHPREDNCLQAKRNCHTITQNKSVTWVQQNSLIIHVWEEGGLFPVFDQVSKGMDKVRSRSGLWPRGEQFWRALPATFWSLPLHQKSVPICMKCSPYGHRCALLVKFKARCMRSETFSPFNDTHSFMAGNKSLCCFHKPYPCNGFVVLITLLAIILCSAILTQQQSVKCSRNDRGRSWT